jgi:hypothetical protein
MNFHLIIFILAMLALAGHVAMWVWLYLICRPDLT